MSERAERKALIKQLGVFEKQCKACPRQKVLLQARKLNTVHPDRHCGGCETYTKIRDIGERLIRMKVSKMKIEAPPRFDGVKTKEDYDQIRAYLDKYYHLFVANYKTDKWVCEHLQVSLSMLKRWKSKRGDQFERRIENQHESRTV